MSTTRKILLTLAALTMVGGTIADASAATWAENHPLRAQVNGRLANQSARIDDNLAKGNITPSQAAQLKSEGAAVRAQERFDASLNGGHLTRAQQRALNQDENAISQQIYNAAH
jgi:hypothetical protein